MAESWKKILSEKHGIDARRIVVLEGKRTPWGNGRLTTWVVPEKAQPPDPLAREPEEIEAEEAEENSGAPSSDEVTSTAPPRFER